MVSTARAGASRRLRGRQGLVSALILIAGVLAGTAGIAAGTSGTGTEHISADLAYRCRLPSGTLPVTVAVSGALPATATPGEREPRRKGEKRHGRYAVAPDCRIEAQAL